MSNRYKDFDAFFAERDRTAKAEPVSFTYGGVIYTLPPELPALVPIRVLRAQKDRGAGAEVATSEVIDMLTLIVGSDQMDSLLNSGITISKLAEVLQWVLAKYRGDETDEGNAETP